MMIALLGMTGCLSGDDPCEGPAAEVFVDQILDPSHSQSFLNTPAAAKDCHAQFTARLAYTGDDAFDPTLARPIVDVSANAVGTGGEQPGLLGIFTTWVRVEDPDTGVISWWAELDAAAKNIDAPAVTYGMAAVLQPGQTSPVDYDGQITYLPPPADPSATARPRTTCRRPFPRPAAGAKLAR